MRLWACCCASALSLSACLIAFSGASIDAYAAYSGGRFMTGQEALDTFGSTIPFKYFNGTGYTDSTFTYQGIYTDSITVYSEDGSYTYQGNTFLCYHSPQLDETVNPDYITVDIAPSSTISNTMQIHTVIACSDGYNSNSYTSNVYQSPSWDWYYDGTSYHIENDDLRASGTGQFAYIRTSGSSTLASTRNYMYVCADLTAAAPTYGYTTRATFSGNVAPYQDPIYRLLIGVPYVDSLAAGETGVVTSPSGGGGSDITVNIDMSETNDKIDETNGLLGSIISWIGNFFVNLGTTVSGWFVPSQNYISNWVGSIVTQLQDAFSPWPSLDSSLTTALNALLGALGEGGASAIEFPAINVPMPDGVNADFSLQSISVPIGQNGPWSDLVRDYVKPIINMVATIAVFNMVLHRIKAVFVGEQVVEVEGSD